MKLSEDEYLAHYGILRRSGRYPWGSGGDQNTRNKSFLDYVDSMKKQGLTEVEIAEGVGISTTELRAAKSIAKNEVKQANITQIEKLRNKGMSNPAISEKTGIPESTVRSLQKESTKEKADILQTSANMLKNEVEEKKFLDVGRGVEHHIGISRNMLDNAVAVLREKGYELHDMTLEQLGTGLRTKFKILALPGTTREQVFANRAEIKQITNFSEDGGRTFLNLVKPKTIHPDRVEVVYGGQGGEKADGVIYVRPGVSDVSLGASQYAQVRIAVGNGHYLKGMAMYKEGLPDGVDLSFNTNKPDTGHKLDALKKVNRLPDGTVDKDNPFGAQISRQLIVKRGGKDVTTSVMNIVNEEGSWGEWSKTLSSQFLSKQPTSLARSQLNMTFEQRKREFDELTSLTNPTVKRKMLTEFGDSADSASVHLKAAALNQDQRTHVILPISSMKPTEVYAPNYADGTHVVLIRHPHGGTFELPKLVVNNNQREAKRLLGNAKDAIGIHHSVAEHLSGADFDGDFVVVVPDQSGKIKTTPGLDGLKDFDPRSQYRAYEGMPEMTTKQKGAEMGDVSNLITDMTIMKASTSELARAVRHSMVVIDAEKHNLNYKQSALDNGIAQLKEKYQGGKRAGAATIISRAGADERVPDFKPRSAAEGGAIDKATGERVFVPTGATYPGKDGKPVLRTKSLDRLATVKDAHTLLSGPNHEGTPMERLYADHSNKLKAMANEARRIAVNTPPSKRSPSAAKIYAPQVKSLTSQLVIAQHNAPLERQAQIIANATLEQKRNADPSMDKATLKKVKAQALAAARNRTGAKKTQIKVTDIEWEAIQAGAVSDSKLQEILTNADMEIIKKHATPKAPKLMTSTMTARAQSMLNSGYTRAEVAKALGVSLTTLDTTTDVRGE